MIKGLKLYSERILLIVIVTLAAIVIPRFVDFLNIMGSLGAAALAFILPPMYYLKCFGMKNLPKHLVVFNIFLIAFGVFGAIYSLVNSIMNIINNP